MNQTVVLGVNILRQVNVSSEGNLSSEDIVFRSEIKLNINTKEVFGSWLMYPVNKNQNLKPK